MRFRHLGSSRRSRYTEFQAMAMRDHVREGKTVLFACMLQETANDMKARLRRLGVAEEQFKLITFQVLGE